MSVFHNVYLQSVEQLQQKMHHDKIVEDFNFFEIYLTSVINTFKWKNIPDEKMPIFLPEQFLQYSGRMIAFEENGMVKLLPAFPSGILTEYGQYSQYTSIALNGKTRIHNIDDIEICYNNCNKMPYYPTIKHFADKSSYALRSVHVSLQKAMMPTVISCENEQQIKLLNDFNYEEKTLKPFIATHKEKFDADSMERQPIFDNRENDVLALWDCYVRYRNMFYATFGINNVEIQKRERLTEAEGSGNDEIVRYSLLDDMYEQRKDFVERVNKRFGAEISVELNRDSATVYELNLTGEEKIENMRIANLKGVNLQGTNTEEKEIDENEENIVEE